MNIKAGYAKYIVKIFFLGTIFLVAVRLRSIMGNQLDDSIGTVDRQAPALDAGISQFLFLVPSLYSGIIALLDLSRRLSAKLNRLLRYSAYFPAAYLNFEAIREGRWNGIYNFALPIFRGQNSTLGFDYSRLTTAALAAMLLLCTLLSLVSYLRNHSSVPIGKASN